MGNRFSTLTQYHSLVIAHGVLAAIVFLFLVPAAIFYARFYTRRPGSAIRYHAYLQILSVLMTICLFILGWFAVGPNRSLTNPHHGIGVAILTLILLQIVGGRLIKNIRGRSLRVMLHQWFGRAIALLGIAQIPLGMTLYGSPKVLFILYAVWMGFLLLLYFIFSYRAYDRPDYHIHEDRSEITRTERTERTDQKSSAGWLGPLAAGTGIWALMRGRKKDREYERDRSRSRSRATRLRSQSRSRAPEVIPSRRGSYIEEEKYNDRYSERPRKSTNGGGGFMDKVLGVGAGLGAGALIGRMMGRKNRVEDEEYSAVAHDTPGRRRRSRSGRRHGGTVMSDYSDESEEYRRDGRRSPLLPGPGGPSAMAAAISAAESRPGGSRPTRPLTPQRSHRPGTSTRLESTIDSDYSSYISPSRRDERRHEDKRQSTHSSGAAEKGLLAGLGVGWFAKKMKDRRDRKEDERMRVDEEERRSGHHESRYTGDGYGYTTPPRRRESRRESLRPPAPIRVETETARMTDESQSLIEPRPLSGYDAPLYPLPTDHYQPQAPPPPGPVPPAVSSYTSHHTGAASGTIPVALDPGTHSREQSRHSVIESAIMPDMPPDPKGILARSSDSGSYMSRRDRRRSESRIRTEEAAAAAGAAAGMAAAEQEAQKRAEEERAASRGRTPPVSVKVKVHDDKDRNVTLRRLTEEEAIAARRARRRRADSNSSISGSEVASGSRSRYRRESSRRRAAEEDAESVVAPLSPPAPSFAGGRRPKDSAYYSGPIPGPSGTTPAAGATVSTLASMSSPGGHGTWSGVSPVGTEPMGGIPGQSEASATASAAERRRRRRLERRNERPAATGTVDFT